MVQDIINEIRRVFTGGSMTGTASVGLSADARNGHCVSGNWTINNASVEAVAIPSGARGAVIYGVTSDFRYAIDEDPVAIGTETLTVGGIARAGVERTVTFEAGAAQLRLLGTSASGLVVTVEFF